MLMNLTIAPKGKAVNCRYWLREVAQLGANGRAEAGDGRAQLILVWQLLLGAGGAAKDVASAGQSDL
jgi:hypothetical protein